MADRLQRAILAVLLTVTVSARAESENAGGNAEILGAWNVCSVGPAATGLLGHQLALPLREFKGFVWIGERMSLINLSGLTQDDILFSEELSGTARVASTSEFNGSLDLHIADASSDRLRGTHLRFDVRVTFDGLTLTRLAEDEKGLSESLSLKRIGRKC